MASGRPRPPSIAFGAHEAFQRPSGIGRYQAELLRQLGPRVDLNVFVHAPFALLANGRDAPPALSHVKVHYPTARPALRANAARIAVGLLRHPYLFDWQRETRAALVGTRLAEGAYADRAAFDLYHGTASYLPITRRVRARVVTVHDVTPVTMPERHVRATVRGFLRPGELRADDQVIMGSASSREDFFTVFDHAKERTHVVPYGIDHEVFRPGGPGSGSPPFIVSVGMIEPRKNLVRALAAFEAVATEHGDLRWKVVGRKGWGWDAFEAALNASPAKDRVDLLGAADDAALPELYRGARCLLFPSLAEGFGIPVLEALACGTPVAASRIPSVVEIAEGAVEFCEPEDVSSIAEAVRRAAFDSANSETRRQAGYERAARFTWQRAADQHLQIYAAALGCAVEDLLRQPSAAPHVSPSPKGRVLAGP